MSDIELPAVDDFLPAEKRWTTANFLACTEAYARAAIIADREKRAQAAQPVQHDSDCLLHNAPALPIGPCDCSVSKPVQAEAPTASNSERPWVKYNPLTATYDTPDGTKIAQEVADNVSSLADVLHVANIREGQRATQQEAQPQKEIYPTYPLC